MRTIMLGVCVAGAFLTMPFPAVAAPTASDEAGLPNIEALGDREPDRWKGRHHYLYDEEFQPGSGTVGGAIHRGWINLKAAVTGKNEEAIINECERGEEHAAHVYEDALQKDLPLDTRAIVERQYRGVVENLERVRALSRDRSTSATGTSGDSTTRTSEGDIRPSA